MDLSLRFIEELALLLLLAAASAYVLARARIPPVLGYLVAGILLGPGGLAIITTVEFVRVLGDLGVVLIMFGLGLDFEFKRLRKTATLSVVAGVGSVITTFVLVNACALLLGLGSLEALFLAAGVSICGTAVNLRILASLGHLKTEYGPSISATIVVTDIAAVLLLTALSGIALGGGLDARVLAFSLFKAIAFLVLAPAFGFILVPKLLNVVARGTRSREVLLITTLGLCFGMALVSRWLGFSLALGAFVMGMVVSKARVYHPIEEMTKPIENIFATLFFFSIGLSIHLGDALPHWGLIALFTAAVVASKLISVSTVAYLSGRSGRVSMAIAWGLVPIGEFAFVITNEGVRLGALTPDYLAVVVVVALLTSGLTVIGLRTLRGTVDRLTDWLPAGVLNLMTVVQLRTAGSGVVPGLASVTRHPGTELRDSTGHQGEAQASLRLSQAREREAYRRVAWGEVIDIGLNTVLILTIALSVVGLGHFLSPIAPSWLNVRLAAMIATLVLIAPSVVLVFRSGADLAKILSHRLSSSFPWLDAGVTRGALLAGTTFLLFVFFQVAFLPLLIVEFENSSTPILIIAGVVTLALGYFAWRSLVRFQTGLTGLVRSSLASAGKETGGRPSHFESDNPAMRPKPVPYRAMIEHFTVPHGSMVIGRSLGESGLRETSGVSVLGIERGGEWIGNPDAGEIIRGGDELVVIGSEDQRERAERFLAERTRGEDGAGGEAP